MPTTKPCAGCGKLTIGDISGRHHLCRTCNNERRHPSGPVEASPAILPPPPPPPGRGRKRKTDENTDAQIIASAAREKFTTPKRIKRQQQLNEKNIRKSSSPLC